MDSFKSFFNKTLNINLLYFFLLYENLNQLNSSFRCFV